MSASGRTPRLVTVLASASDPEEEIAADLYRELVEVNPAVAMAISPTSLGDVFIAMEDEAPDGWPFGVNTEGNLGYWPLGTEYWEEGSLYDHA